MPTNRPLATALPPRFKRPSLFTWGIALAFLALFIEGTMATNVTLERLLRGVVNLSHFSGPRFPSRSQQSRCIGMVDV